MIFPTYILVPLAVLLAAEAVRAVVNATISVRAILAVRRTARAITKHFDDTRNGMDATGQALKDVLRNGGGHR